MICQTGLDACAYLEENLVCMNHEQLTKYLCVNFFDYLTLEFNYHLVGC